MLGTFFLANDQWNFMPLFTDFDCKFIKSFFRLVKAAQLLRLFWYPKSSITMKSADGSSELENLFVGHLYFMHMKFKILNAFFPSYTFTVKL